MGSEAEARSGTADSGWRGAVVCRVVAVVAALIAVPVWRAAAAAGAVLSVDEMPRDATGSLLADGLPDVLPPRDGTALTSEPFLDLELERDRAVGTITEPTVPDTIPALPGDELAPARMDSGDPDPDRLAPESWPVQLRSLR